MAPYAAAIEATDAELVARAQQGDRAAMEALLGRHYERVHTICRRIAGNEADADDACQEALMAIVRGLARFDGRSSFRTWSYRVASNACLDEMRRKNRRPVPRDLLPEGPDAGPGIDAVVADRLTLDEALPRLSDEFRVPVVLRDVAGLDYAEIAETLGIPPGTVRSRIARGRRQLAGLVGNQMPPGERQR
ncbi:MAG: RNA polymerase sigma factor [Acidimicrobiales bacterium]